MDTQSHPNAQLLLGICVLADSLPENIPLANSDDPIVVLGTCGEDFMRMNDLTNNTTDDWEVYFSLALHKVTWGESIETIKPLIQRGMNGIVRFCSVLVFFTQK